ncbi:MAG: DNA mismatch repair endonuclease MutL [Planctomycetota bacterium]
MTATGAPATTRDGATARPIRRLPPLLVNQIAAGEVIERPASVVKELVENALDAGAARVEVELEEGGARLVRVTDDGRGIDRGQLALAIAPHATSKIAEQDDLDRIATMGFRGEALASIASVSRLSIRSRARGSGETWLLETEGETVHEPRPAGGPAGTSVTVRDLFFNTPARRKFLRTAPTEKSRCLDWLRDLALAHPGVAFRLVADGKTVFDVARADDARTRSIDVLGRELEPELLEVSVDRFDDARGVLVWGLVGRPSIARPNARAQHLFLNGRAIKDKTVQHAVREAYRGLIDHGRHPTCVLLIEMAPDAVDVNVHPAKLEVRFRDSSAVHHAVYHGVKEALRKADLTPEIGDALRAPPTPVFGPRGAGGSAELFAARVRELAGEAQRVADSGWADSGWGPPAGGRLDEPGSAPVHAPRTEAIGFAEPAGLAPAPARAARVLQLHDSYLVVEDADGMLIIDQHALHERVMFQKLLERVGRAKGGSGTLESQALLAPAVADLEPSALAVLDDLRPLLATLGIEAEPMGPRSIGVRSFPSLLLSRRVEPAPFVAELLARAERDPLPASEEGALHEVLDMMACKAAVKAGDRLSELEIDELLRLRETVERSSACPHGRPTSVRVTIPQLEKLFHRR